MTIIFSHQQANCIDCPTVAIFSQLLTYDRLSKLAAQKLNCHSCSSRTLQEVRSLVKNQTCQVLSMKMRELFLRAVTRLPSPPLHPPPPNFLPEINYIQS